MLHQFFCNSHIARQVGSIWLSASVKTWSRVVRPLNFKYSRLYFSTHIPNNEFCVASINTLHNRLRSFSTSSSRLIEETDESKIDDDEKKNVDPSKIRSKIIPPEVSLRYMESKAYQTTYGNDPVHLKYRRNFKGQRQPSRTRQSCIKKNVVVTGNPCPICRDEYLILHYTNVKLLKQFICPFSGEIYVATKTGLCRVKQLQLEVAIEQARDRGLLTFHVPFRKYDYSQYYPQDD